MTKDELHYKLSQVKAKASDIAVLTEDDFIEVYGDNQTRMINGKESGRPDVLATVYQLNVTKDQSNYTFTRAI